MSENGVSHVEGVCDNCGKVGKWGWVVGRPDKTHLHACTNPECRDALERLPAPPVYEVFGSVTPALDQDA